MLTKTYAEYATEKAVSLLAIDSPTGYTKAAAEWVKAEFAALGYPAEITVKGGVLIDLGGEASPEGGLLPPCHCGEAEIFFLPRVKRREVIAWDSTSHGPSL